MVDYVPRLKAKYTHEIRGVLKEKFAYKNEMMIPKLQKIVLNMGVGEAVGDSKKIKSAMPGAFPIIQKAFETIGFAKVATSAKQAQAIGYLRKDDKIIVNLLIIKSHLLLFVPKFLCCH